MELGLNEKVVASHLVECYGGAKALLIIFESGSVDVKCRNFDFKCSVQGINKCIYKKY